MLYYIILTYLDRDPEQGPLHAMPSPGGRRAPSNKGFPSILFKGFHSLCKELSFIYEGFPFVRDFPL